MIGQWIDWIEASTGRKIFATSILSFWVGLLGWFGIHWLNPAFASGVIEWWQGLCGYVAIPLAGLAIGALAIGIVTRQELRDLRLSGTPSALDVRAIQNLARIIDTLEGTSMQIGFLGTLMGMMAAFAARADIPTMVASIKAGVGNSIVGGILALVFSGLRTWIDVRMPDTPSVGQFQQKRIDSEENVNLSGRSTLPPAVRYPLHDTPNDGAPGSIHQPTGQEGSNRDSGNGDGRTSPSGHDDEWHREIEREAVPAAGFRWYDRRD